jgi:hypothetical protein
LHRLRWRVENFGVRLSFANEQARAIFASQQEKSVGCLS